MFRIAYKQIVLQRSIIICGENRISNKNVKRQNSQDNSSKIPDVKGFSDTVVKIPDTPVGFAGASKVTEYKNPEYFCYHVDSFGNSMVELEKYRLPAPSSKAKK